MDELNELQPTPVEPGSPGSKIQGITAAAIVAAGALLKGGVIGASIANPIAAGAAFVSAFLPALFGRRKKAAPQGLLAAPPSGAGRLAAAGVVIAQIVALLTAFMALLHQIPPEMVPMSWQPWVALVAAAVGALLPGLQKLADILRSGG